MLAEQSSAKHKVMTILSSCHAFLVEQVWSCDHIDQRWPIPLHYVSQKGKPISIITACGFYVHTGTLLHQGPPRAGLSEADAGALEERALKMRKAMGENLADDVAGESPDARTRRLNLIKCAPLPAALAGQTST